MIRPYRAAIGALVALFLIHMPVTAADTSWMLEGKYGVFLHYQHRILLGYSYGADPISGLPSFGRTFEM